MSKQVINVGAAANDGTGTPTRTAFQYVNANFVELYNFITGTANGTTLPAALPIAKGGTGATSASTARSNLGLGSAATGALTTSKSDATVGSVLKVGDFGLGVLQSIITADIDLNSVSSGAYNITSSAINSPGAGWLQSRNWTGDQTALVKQVWTAAYTADMRIRQKTAANGNWSSWKKVWTEDNTTTDSNGFIKAASPIVQLFSEKIELNDEAKQQDIKLEKVTVGSYLVKGSTGFAQEGWYVEMPKDANGNVLVAVVYEQLENKDISVKTYKKKFDLETASIVADLTQPVDIPEGRWIDLRLQELPQEVIDES